MLHISNGSSVSLEDADLPGECLFWADPLYDGPVPGGLALRQLSAVRESFLTRFFELPPGEVDFADRDSALERSAGHDEVVLWFEHDLYDQLQLVQILDYFAGSEHSRLSLIQEDRYLGCLEPKELADLFPSRRAVTREQLALAAQVWTAFRAPSPEALRECLHTDLDALPYLRSALERFLEEYPAPENGLSRTERQGLQLIDSGLHEFRDIFQATHVFEDAVFLGDLSFRQYLRELALAPRPLLIEKGTRYELTTAGGDVLAGRANRIRLNGLDRWFGGFHLTLSAG